MTKTFPYTLFPKRRDEEWSRVQWADIEIKVYQLQQRIYQASLQNEKEEYKRLQEILIKQPEAKLLAVRRVTQDNRGKKTSGVDGQSQLTKTERLQLVETLELNDKASPIRRVLIPKPGTTEKRPLGIPTMRDRAKQALAHLALDPQWEGIFSKEDWYSFGFRPGRSADDARRTVTRWLRRPRYVLDADIRKCFDRIDHMYLLRKLECSSTLLTQTEAWLKAGICEGFESEPTEENTLGTPQGGIISPLLANVALCGMHQAADPFWKKKTENWICKICR